VPAEQLLHHGFCFRSRKDVAGFEVFDFFAKFPHFAAALRVLAPFPASE